LVLALKTGFLPRWLAFVGVALAVLLMFGQFSLIVFVPLPLLVLWIFLVSILLFLRERRSRPPAGEVHASASPLP
jgi:hypothetical protein